MSSYAYFIAPLNGSFLRFLTIGASVFYNLPMTAICCTNTRERATSARTGADTEKGNPSAARPYGGRASGRVLGMDGRGDTGGDGDRTQGRLLGYARVSTEEQTLALQLDALGRAGCAHVFRDVGISGAARQRPGLERCLAALRPGDVLVVWTFDRAFRSLKHALDTLEDFEARGIDFRELAHNIDTTTAMGRAFFHIRGAFAELERGLAAERTVAGMNAARRRGARIGRPPLLEAGEIAAMHRRIGGGEITLRAAAARLGVHPDTLSRGFRREGLAGGGAAGAVRAGGGDG